MTLTRAACRYCQRLVSDDSPCGCCCTNCDYVPPRRITVPSVGQGAAIVLALVVIGVAVGLLLTAFYERHDVLPSPDGPVVVEVPA